MGYAIQCDGEDATVRLQNLTLDTLDSEACMAASNAVLTEVLERWG